MSEGAWGRELAWQLGPGTLSEAEPHRRAYGRGAPWGHGTLAPPWPRWVAWPRVPEQVGQIVTFCHDRGIPWRPVGGNSHGVVWPEGSLALDLKHLHRVLHVDGESLVGRVQAGDMGGQAQTPMSKGYCPMTRSQTANDQ